MQTNTKILIDKNQNVNRETLTSNTGHIIGQKQYASREYVIMIKETSDKYREKSNYLQKLKLKLHELEQNNKNLHTDIANKVTDRVHKHQQKLRKTKTNPESSQTSEYGTNATTIDEQLASNYIPNINLDIERILLFKKREREDAKKKLNCSKEIVIAACGLVSRICKEIRITNQDNKEISVDVIENNISDYMSLWGLKFEKLMRNNKLIKAQYERLVEINMQRSSHKIDIYNQLDAAEIYGFARINLRKDPDAISDDDED
jgi:hypothetical protein